MHSTVEARAVKILDVGQRRDSEGASDGSIGVVGSSEDDGPRGHESSHGRPPSEYHRWFILTGRNSRFARNLHSDPSQTPRLVGMKTRKTCNRFATRHTLASTYTDQSPGVSGDFSRKHPRSELEVVWLRQHTGLKPMQRVEYTFAN